MDQPMTAPRETARGFTLLELMIALVIVGILTAIAVPGYQDYVLRGNRTLAKVVLQEVASRQEGFYMDRKGYSTTLAALGYPADPFYLGKNGSPTASTSGALYSVTISNASTTTWTVTAATLASGQQSKDTACATLSMSHLGVKAATGGGGSDCWTR